MAEMSFMPISPFWGVIEGILPTSVSCREQIRRRMQSVEADRVKVPPDQPELRLVAAKQSRNVHRQLVRETVDVKLGQE
jgi:hypothetical protein